MRVLRGASSWTVPRLVRAKARIRQQLRAAFLLQQQGKRYQPTT